MSDVSFEVRVDSAAAVRYFRTRQGRLLAEVRPAFLGAGRRIMQRLALYPQQPRGANYVRTGTLGRRWQMRDTMGGGRIHVNVYNATWYAPYVQSKTYQARVHRGRWLTDVDALKSERGRVLDDVSGALIRVFR